MSDLSQYLLAQAARRPLATARFAVGEAWRRSRMRWSNGIERSFPSLATAGLAERFAPFLPSGLNSLEHTRRFPGRSEQIQAHAQAICRHEFEIFGHSFAANAAINWHRDYQADHEWPCSPQNELRILDTRAGADVKRPWELSRFHHALTLGQAYFLTQDESYAREFSAQVLDWAEASPYPRGIHWAMPMEVGLRVVNLCTAGTFFANAACLKRDFWQQFLALLFLHGRYLNLHREWNPVARGNHHLGSLLGVLYAGALFRGEAEGRAWFEDARAAIRSEMDSQVGADGVAHEGSSNYHLLVTEMMTAAAIVAARATGQPLDQVWDADFRKRWARMFEFPAALADGRTSPPILGDSDDGRLLPFCHAPQGVCCNHALATGSALFARPEWRANSHACEQPWWLLGSATERDSAITSTGGAPRTAFSDAGFYFFHSERIRGSVRCGPLGVNGWANHAHCDQLNVEFCLDGAPVLLDPGTYVYSGDPQARNEFRSSRAHNAPVVDGAEQNRYWPGLLFRIMDDTRSVAGTWEETATAVRFAGEHHGYARLLQQVRVQRHVTLDREQHSLLIVDSLTGAGSSTVEWFWQFAPGIVPAEALSRKTAASPVEATLHAPLAWFAGPVEIQMWLPREAGSVRRDVVDGWVAPRYGHRERAKQLRISCRAPFPLQAAFLFTPRAPRGPEKP